LQVSILPQDVGIEDPPVGESGAFCLPGQGDGSFWRKIAFQGDAEFHDKLLRRWGMKLAIARRAMESQGGGAIATPGSGSGGLCVTLWLSRRDAPQEAPNPEPA
jgi:hypothetical protein